ncbi:MAG: pilus assembly protein PilM [Candidatus Omnitrophica bacterium]|nr:pilus assembly protein PilM [Candidatus Omnitrophota bacterium]MDD5670104.1 pilus assembly protein PilM [Candidatus Omnitrophota bacterium]
MDQLSKQSWLDKVKSRKSLSLGIDQGSSAVRFVLFDCDKRKIVQWGSYELTQSHQEKGKRNVQSFLRELSKNLPIHQIRSINVNIQGPSVVLGRVEIPRAEKNEQPNLVRLALRSQLTFPVDSAAFYFREYNRVTPLEGKKEEHGVDKHVFNFVAVEKSTISAILDPVADLFKMVPIVTIQGYAQEKLVDLFNLSSPDETVAFLNIGRGISVISIFQDKKLVFERQIPLAGQDITRSILIMYRTEDSLGAMLDLETAEKLKRASYIPVSRAPSPNADPAAPKADAQETHGLNQLDEAQNQKLFQSIQGVLTAWVQDIKLSFNYFYEHYDPRKITKLYVLGGGAGLKNIVLYLSRKLEIETNLLKFPENAPISIEKKQDANLFKKEFHEYATATAFAFKTDRQATLTPQESQKANYANLLEPIIRLVFIMVASVFLTWYLFLHVQCFYLKNIKSVLQTHYFFLGKVEAPYLEMVKWQKFIKETGMKIYPASQIMRAINQRIPQNLLLMKFSINREQQNAGLEGRVFGEPKKQAVTVAEFSKALGESVCLKQITVPSLDSSRDNPDEGTFRLTAKLNEISGGAS